MYRHVLRATLTAFFILGITSFGCSTPQSLDIDPDDPDQKQTETPTESTTATPASGPTCEERLTDMPAGWPTTQVGVEIGDSLPIAPSCLAASDGTTYAPGDFLGRVVLVSAGSGWCSPCRAEATHLGELYEEFKDQGFIILMSQGMGWTQGSEPNAAFLDDWSEQYNNNFPVLSDPGFTWRQKYADGMWIPLNVFLNKNGEVIYSEAGGITKNDARAVIEGALLGESIF